MECFIHHSPSIKSSFHPCSFSLIETHHVPSFHFLQFTGLDMAGCESKWCTWPDTRWWSVHVEMTVCGSAQSVLAFSWYVKACTISTALARGGVEKKNRGWLQGKKQYGRRGWARLAYILQARSQTFLWGRGVGCVKLVKFWDHLWLRVDNLAIALDLAIFFGGGGGVQVTPLTPPSLLWLRTGFAIYTLSHCSNSKYDCA